MGSFAGQEGGCYSGTWSGEVVWGFPISQERSCLLHIANGPRGAQKPAQQESSVSFKVSSCKGGMFRISDSPGSHVVFPQPQMRFC